MIEDVVLDVQRTVDRALVHKAAVSEVFITDWKTVRGVVWVAAQWPRRHWFFGDTSPRLVPLLIMETFRQAWILVAHSSFGVPLSSHVVMEEIGLRIDQPVVAGDQMPPVVRLRFSTVHVARSAVMVSSLELSAEILVGDAVVGYAWGRARLVTGAVYQRMRRQHVRHEGDAGEPVTGRVVVVDLEHPVFFDHPNDHVPGMLLVSAACDAVPPGNAIRRVEARFSRYFELNSSVWMDATDPGSGLMDFRFAQSGVCGAEIEIGYEREGEGTVSAVPPETSMTCPVVHPAPSEAK